MVTLRRVSTETENIAQLAEIARTTFGDTFRGTLPDEDLRAYLDEAYAPEVLAREVADPNSAVWFAEVDGRPVAYLKVNVGPAQTEPMGAEDAELQRIYVLDSYHGRRIGAQLLDHALSWAKEQGKQRLWLGVWEFNEAAQRFYRRNGFRRIGEHDFVMGGVTQTDWILARDL